MSGSTCKARKPLAPERAPVGSNPTPAAEQAETRFARAGFGVSQLVLVHRSEPLGTARNWRRPGAQLALEVTGSQGAAGLAAGRRSLSVMARREPLREAASFEVRWLSLGRPAPPDL